MPCEKAHTFGNWGTKEKLSSCLLWPSSYFIFIVLEECNRWASYFLSINTSDICLICLAAEHRTTNQKTPLAKWKWLLEILAPILFFEKWIFLSWAFSIFLSFASCIHLAPVYKISRKTTQSGFWKKSLRKWKKEQQFSIFWINEIM